MQEADDNLDYPVIAADFVSMDDGTGIVHIAPSFGEVDFQAGEAMALILCGIMWICREYPGNLSLRGEVR